MKSAIKPEACPVCGNVPEVICYTQDRFVEYNCRCEACRKRLQCTVNMTLLEDKVVYGAYSQTSESAAIRNWNSIIYRHSARMLKEALKPPKIVDVVQLLEDKKACEHQISRMKTMLAYWDVCKSYIESKSASDKEAMRILSLINAENV